MQPSIIKTIVRVFIFLIIEAILTICYFYFAAYQLPNILNSPIMFLIYPILTFIIVLLISLLTHFVFIRNGSYFYLFKGLMNLSFVIYILVLGCYFYNQRNYNKTHGYNAENQEVIEMAYNDGNIFIGYAFEKLQSQFKSPRNLDLHSYVAKDTNLVSNGASKKAQIVYFIYSLRDDKNNNQYFSKVYVSDLSPQLVFFNDLITDDKEYNYVKELKKEDGNAKGYKIYLPINSKQTPIEKIINTAVDTTIIKQELIYEDSLKSNQ